MSKKQKKEDKPNCIIRALGHKSDPYFKTEDEMLNEPVYTYESLSTSEKEIYDKSRKNQ